MGRNGGQQRQNEFQCRNPKCGAIFDAGREDAKYCSPACRQVMSRAMRALFEHQKNATVLNADGKTECLSCGSKRNGLSRTCPVCGSKRHRRAKK